MKIGDVVWTPTRRPVGTGVITAMSECGRYAVVEKVYGRRCRWKEQYHTSDLRQVGNDPYHEKRTYHKAHLVDDKGNVSPLCADKPKALNLKKHQLWTLRWELVTCRRCLAQKP